MPAGLMSDNSVYSLEKVPWHELGVVSHVKMGAQQALGRIDSPFYVKRAPMVTLDGNLTEYGDWVVIRSPIPSDPHERVVGTVKKNYKILQPLDIATTFDVEVDQPVETLGFLGTYGNKMFLTWKLPAISVKGDIVELFGFVAVGYDGKFGATLYIVSVRVVCSNTFSQAISEAESTNKRDKVGKIWTGRHNSGNLERDLGIWMNHIDERAKARSEEASRIFNAMAEVAIRDQATLDNLLGKVYPDPKPIPSNYPIRLLGEKQEKNLKIKLDAQRDRNLVQDLFDGAGVEITHDAWGLFNAITEYENHKRPSKKATDYSIIMGNRAGTMNKAFNILSQFVLVEK